MPQPRQGPALEGGLGLVLEEGVVAVVPDIDEGPAVHLQVEADGHQQVDRHQDGPVEQFKADPGPADRRQGETEQQAVGPQTEQRKKEGAGKAGGGADAQQHQRQGEGSRHDAPAQPRPGYGGGHSEDFLSEGICRTSIPKRGGKCPVKTKTGGPSNKRGPAPRPPWQGKPGAGPGRRKKGGIILWVGWCAGR